MEQKINRFDGGITNNTRNPDMTTSRVVTNFDIFTNPYKLTPYKNSESGDSAASTSKKQNFAIALRTGTTYRLYGLGVVSGTERAEVLMKDLTTSSSDLSDDLWITPTNNASSSGSTSFNLFVYYKKTGLIYGARAGTHIWAFDPSSVIAWADTNHALTYTNIAQGLVHSKDDILYIPYDNKIAKNDNGSWTDAALTLPSNVYITSICEYGNYLAIAATDLSGVEKSVVYLWDRDTSLTTLSEKIDYGEGVLKVLEEVDGVLIGISLLGGVSTIFEDRVIFRYLNGNKAEKFREIREETGSITLEIAKQKANNRLYFMMSVTLNGTKREGVWSIGQSSSSAPFALSHERTPNNATALTNGTLNNFIVIGDYMFISYVDSSVYALSKTNADTTGSTAAIYESVKFSNDRSLASKLIGVTVAYEPVDGGTITLKYKIQGETSYTTIFAFTAVITTNFHSAINIESSGATLPEFKEIEFQITVSGAIEITELSFMSEKVGKRLY